MNKKMIIRVGIISILISFMLLPGGLNNRQASASPDAWEDSGCKNALTARRHSRI